MLPLGAFLKAVAEGSIRYSNSRFLDLAFLTFGDR